jgi:S-adenosylmethionine synthetase
MADRFQPQSSAKSLVSAGLAQRVLVQLSYAIGVAEPLSIFVDTYGTGTKSDQELVEIIRKNFDLRPGVIGVSVLRRAGYRDLLKALPL